MVCVALCVQAKLQLSILFGDHHGNDDLILIHLELRGCRSDSDLLSVQLWHISDALGNGGSHGSRERR